MKRNFVLISMLALIILFSACALAEDATGNCGENATWRLTDHTLTISGYGEIDKNFRSNIITNFYGDYTSLIIEEGITSIPDDAFCKNKSLQNVSLPSSLKTIGSYAFSETSIKSIELPSGLNNVGDGVFSFCQELTKLSIPGTVKEIPYCFAEFCFKLNEIIINEGTIGIEGNAFQNTGAAIVKLPLSIQYINSQAFSGCDVSKVYFSGSRIQTIDINIDSYNDDLKDATWVCNDGTINNGLYSVDAGVCGIHVNWFFCDDTLIISGNGEMYDYAGRAGTPWFYKENVIEKIIIENGITRIGNNSFDGYGIKSVEFPSSLVEVGNNAFSDCANLNSINFNYGLKKIGEKAFYRTGNIKELKIPNTLETMGNMCFSESDVEKVILPDSLLDVGSGVFSKCLRLKEINIPGSINTIPQRMLEGCNSIKSIVVGNGITSIDSYAFYNSGIVEITLPISIKEIGKDVFNSSSISTIIYQGTRKQAHEIDISDDEHDEIKSIKWKCTD